MAKVRRSMGERSRRWHHVTESSEDLLADIPALRESVEKPRELSDEILDHSAAQRRRDRLPNNTAGWKAGPRSIPPRA
jgi:hypothetical protein